MIIVNEGKMKASIAYLNAEDLMATLETAADYLARHNKNMTKKQDYAAEMLKALVESLEIKEV